MNFGKRLPGYFLKRCYSRLIEWRFYTQSLYKPFDIHELKDVLVIRTDGLGDLILADPLFKLIKQTSKGVRVALISRGEWKEIFERSPYVDEVIPWDIQKYARSLRYRMNFIRALRTRTFDAAIHPVYSREPLSDEITCCTRAALKIGFDGDLNNIEKKRKRQNDRCYARLIRHDAVDCTELERNRHFAEQLVGMKIRADDFQPELWLTDEDRLVSAELLRRYGIDPDQNALIALFPGASSAYKTWPPESYADLGNRILQYFDSKFVICGTHAEADIARVVASEIHGPVVNLAGKTSLTQLAAVLECSDLYIGSDTGPLHMAAAVGTPTLAIMGGGHFGRFYPYGDLNKHQMVFKKMSCYGCNWKCIYETTRCIQEITVDDVWREAQRMIEEVVLPRREARAMRRPTGVAIT